MSRHPMTDAAQTILIIDDNPVNLGVLGDHLRQRGFMVVVAQDGEEGLERAEVVKPDLILLDIMMPGINGLETCRRLKASDATREIPVIFKTALTDTATKIAGFEAGGVDYVTSPIQIEEVMARVQTHLTLHRVKKRLEQARAELEDRVQQRTVELRAEVAERKRAEDEVRDTAAQWQATFDAVQDVVLLLDKDFRVVRANHAATKFLGLPIDNIVGVHCYDLIHGTTAPPEECPLAKMRQSLRHEEEEVLAREGGPWLLVSVDPVFDPSGELIHAVHVARDITERKRAEEALKRMNRELRAISDCNQMLLRASDERTLVNEICRIVCEEAGYRMAWVGYAEHDQAKTVRPVAWAGVEEGYLRAANISWSEENEPGRGPTGTVLRSGTTYYNQDFACDAQSSPWRESALQRGYRSSIALPLKDEHASAFGALTIYSSEPNAFSPEEIRLLEELAGDLAFGITVIRARIERKQAEEEKAKLQQHLQQAQKMEAIGQIAGGVAHDFNNILGIINGYSEILLSRRKLDEEQRSQVEEILAAGQRAASLTRQLLAFSRKLVLQPKVLSLNSVIEGFEKMLRRLIGDEIEVRTTLDPNLSAVNADPNQMEQVLMNFCINARDAMPQGGKITIETENVELDDAMAARFSLTPGRYVTLSVSDSGIGMDHATQSHIFEPFFTTKGPEHGTGLGLATVYGIVRQSDGHVSVYSEPGRGSTFRVHLPAVNQRTKEDEQSSKALELLRGSETILLVEDAAPLRTLYRKILEEKGYTVLEAGDGERALQVAEQYHGNLALLLSDVSLPKMKGPALAKILLQQRPTMKVLFMSGHSDEVVSGRDHLLAGGAGFIQKPFGAEDLFRKLREILNSQQSGGFASPPEADLPPP